MKFLRLILKLIDLIVYLQGSLSKAGEIHILSNNSFLLNLMIKKKKKKLCLRHIVRSISRTKYTHLFVTFIK